MNILTKLTNELDDYLENLICENITNLDVHTEELADAAARLFILTQRISHTLGFLEGVCHAKNNK